MADLGNLFFSLGLDTKQIDAAWDKALAKYGKLAKIDIKVDSKELTEAQNKTKLLAEANKQVVITKKAEQQIEREVNKTKQANLLLEEKMRTQVARTNATREKGIAAVKKTNSVLNVQHRLVQNLHTMAASYISIFAAGRIVKDLVRITGEFEMQKVALQAILGDLHGANAIFDQIKTLAVKSPFQFKDLISYTKQLSAFSIPMGELYDTTKMLADVSAGLGVGMDRLVLAYGQIRAASVLRGQEIRQLTEAGIPVIEQLRVKFEELGEVGITAADVFDKVSARLVPFSMIKEMFEDMTSEGGKFFMMQEIQAETLKGKVSNLVDAYQIMMAEIGGKSEGVLKGAVDLTKELMANYEAVGEALMSLVATYGVYKAATIGLNAVELVRYNLTLKIGAAEAKVTALQAVRILTTNGLTAATERLNAALLKNPYVLIGVAIAGLAYTIYKITTYTNDYDKALNKLKKTSEETSFEVTKEQTELAILYAKLKNATKGTKEYDDAKSAINRKYGEYLKNLKDEHGNIVELADAYDSLAKSIQNAAYERAFTKSIESATDEYTSQVSVLFSKMKKSIESRVSKGLLSKEQGAEYLVALLPVLRGEKEFGQLNKDIQDFVNSTKAAANVVSGLGSMNQPMVVSPVSDALGGIIERGKEAARIYNGVKEEAASLFKFLKTEDEEQKVRDPYTWEKNLSEYSKEMNEAFKNMLTRTDEERPSAFISRLRDEYKSTSDLLKVESKLSGQNVDALTKKLEVLAGAFKVLGISPKEEKEPKGKSEATRALEKLIEERDNYRLKKESDLQNELISEEIRGSKEKVRIIENTYKKEMFSAEKFRKERLKLINQSKGLLPSNRGYITELSGADLEEYNALISAAGEKRSVNTIKLERETASEITKIWKQATESTLSNYDREKEAIVEKYRLLIERAQDAAAEEKFIGDIKRKENDALISLDVEYGLALIDQDQEVKTRLAETSKKYFDEQKEQKRQQLQIDIDAAQERVAMLQAEEALTGKDNSREISRWLDFIVQATKHQKQLKDNYFVIGEMLGEALSQSSDEFVQKIGDIISTLSSAMGNIQKAYGKDGTSLDKATSIVGLIMSANNMLKQAREEAANPELERQRKITSQVADRVSFEQQINNLLRERREMSDEDMFKVVDNIDRINKAVARASELSKGTSGILSDFINNAIFSSEGTGKRRLFGSKTATYDFTLADVLKGLSPEGGDRNSIAGGGLSEIVGAIKGENSILDVLASLLDPADVLQGRYADANAKKDAFLNLQKTVQDALKAMGKSVSDFANMSADDLLTFFSLMESAGTITDEGTKKLLDAAKEQVENVKSAIEDMKQAFSDIVGDLGSSLSNLLVDAFTNGNVYGAIDAFHDKIGNVISDIVAQMVFAATLQPFLKKASVAFMASYGMKPDGSPLDDLKALKADGTAVVDHTIVDDLHTLGNDIAGGIGAYEKALKEADDKLRGMGYKGITSGSTSPSLGGAIQATVTEKTANLLGSYINAMRADGAKRTMLAEKMLPIMNNINDTMGNGLAHLAAISSNTLRSANNTDAIVDKLNALTTPNGTTKLNTTVKV